MVEGPVLAMWELQTREVTLVVRLLVEPWVAAAVAVQQGLALAMLQFVGEVQQQQMQQQVLLLQQVLQWSVVRLHADWMGPQLCRCSQQQQQQLGLHLLLLLQQLLLLLWPHLRLQWLSPSAFVVVQDDVSVRPPALASLWCPQVLKFRPFFPEVYGTFEDVRRCSPGLGHQLA